MKLPKIALAGVISLTAVLAAVGVAGAATDAQSAGNTQQHQASFAKHQLSRKGSLTLADSDKAKHFTRGKGHGFPVLGAAAQLLGMQPQDLAAELKTGNSLKDVAAAKGMDSAKLAQDLQTTLSAKIDQAVQNGKLTADQATAIKSRIPQQVQAMLDRKWDGQQKGQGFRGTKGIFKGINEQIQTLLGIDSATLKTELKNGKSLAEIAQAKNIAKDTLVAKIQSAIGANLDQAVKDQKLTSDQAAKIKANLPQKIEAMVTNQHVHPQPHAKPDQAKRPNAQQNSNNQA